MRIASTLLAASMAICASSACSTLGKVKHTFYGFPDNTPASNQIAYDCGRGYEAGGTGAYANPLTFATAPGEFKKCEIIYDPYLKKYLRFEDTCAQCTTDWKKGIYHIDIWTGANSNGGQTQINCENALTPDKTQTIIKSPSKTLPVDTTALFSGGKCHTDHVYKSYNPSDYCKNSSRIMVREAQEAQE